MKLRRRLKKVQKQQLRQLRVLKRLRKLLLPKHLPLPLSLYSLVMLFNPQWWVLFTNHPSQMPLLLFEKETGYNKGKNYVSSRP